ncbi:unnamed protein product [Acanthoscelides obtectus]|uniref:MGAT4 A/B/C C-terminal domain-containing protein n=1 Tax=Acanthoscelides obtectus TaxID=200917 RepID=A0A9P0LH43_ACAOB|nr:unnamed protein product [Acanthoscelides obtectus]CAK1645818.1 Alpha-1,3-mannosyl-glycoprotein 4-beta-N-acetylglucosaminyltransferase B [Acanthoscelides obtectus]
MKIIVPTLDEELDRSDEARDNLHSASVKKNVTIHAKAESIPTAECDQSAPSQSGSSSVNTGLSGKKKKVTVFCCFCECEVFHFPRHLKRNHTNEIEDYCKRDKAKVWLHYKPSLFQHIGIHSSLKGKVQKLKDKQFGKIPLFFPHTNPEAEVVSGIKHYKQYTLERAYLGETFFWGLLPQPGDQLLFRFSQPINIKRFYFKSGNAEHPSDKLYNTTVEVLPVVDALLYATGSGGGGSYNLTTDGYIVVENAKG